MSGDETERSYFWSTKPGKAVYSKAIDSFAGKKIRIVSEIIEGTEGLRFAVVKDDLVLRTTPAGRYKLKATFVEDDREIRSLVFQRYLNTKGPLERDQFTLVHKEVDTLIQFLHGIRTVDFESDGKKHVTDEQLRNIKLNEAKARGLFEGNEDLFIKIAENEELQRDLVAIGYRRKQLERFEKLLNDPDYFNAAQATAKAKRPEDLWQLFFEANTWIFGYGLSFQFVTELDDAKLEQIVRGADVTGPGKRTDALMKTRARVNSLCFVEIKRHDKGLLGTEYRSGAWSPSRDLSGGVSQVQATVQDSVERLGRSLRPTRQGGDPTGETLFNINPRAFLVIGNLDEFMTEQGVNEEKFRSFEMYRRNMRQPEIITFDELLHRARFIVEHGEDITEDADSAREEDVPF
ncbi:Shedu immune nuclease family protein [Parasphingopyxis sp.]|uniref:Shedu immune nuclease family protein n=1 Tax=Parasphingopyxis sp. TaxID=1920299 RepID=UPI0026192FE6|nr:Shedu immune nuclease family protein [Parasphingopyxis sp.]